jgi:arginine/lysine/ornithine decarboxylase
MAEHGHALLADALELARQARAEIAQIAGLHVHGKADFCGPGRAAELDPLQLVIDISELGVDGYHAADWLREQHHIDMHVSDHRRVSAQLSYADGEDAAARLRAALTDLANRAGELPPAAKIAVPDPEDLRLELAHPPREAFFGRAEQIPADRAAGRVAAEMLTPYPPGIPAALPGERLTGPLLDYLRGGIKAGMVVPDAADPSLDSVRVLIE